MTAHEMLAVLAVVPMILSPGLLAVILTPWR